VDEKVKASAMTGWCRVLRIESGVFAIEGGGDIALHTILNVIDHPGLCFIYCDSRGTVSGEGESLFKDSTIRRMTKALVFNDLHICPTIVDELVRNIFTLRQYAENIKPSAEANTAHRQAKRAELQGPALEFAALLLDAHRGKGIDSIRTAVVDKAIQKILAVGVRGILNWEGLNGWQLFMRIRGPKVRGKARGLGAKELARQWNERTEAARQAWRDLAASGVRPTEKQLKKRSLLAGLTKRRAG
jgi:hypothetical protein